MAETNGTLSAALRPEKEPARLADLQLKVTHTNATIPFVLDGQVLEDNLRWCGKDRAWLERTASSVAQKMPWEQRRGEARAEAKIEARAEAKTEAKAETRLEAGMEAEARENAPELAK